MLKKIKPQPFVKWVGGKRSLLESIHANLPEKFNNYFEPFAGGGAVFFSLYEKIDKATLADTNLELVLAYNAIKKEPEALVEKLKKHAKQHSKDYYYDLRSKEQKNPMDIAARFLYLNKTCFNGLYRVNSSGKFNSPMGSYNNPNIIQEENILACHEVLQGVDIKFGDFTSINPEKGDFVYFDPPYHPTSEVSFTEYTKENFTEKDQVRLRDFIVTLHKKGVKIMLSNSKTKLIEDIYRAKYFKHHVVMAPRYVNCKSSERSKVQELLITNY
ncbi:DNA adenine methylase [Patescibacteria group bacterium]